MDMNVISNPADPDQVLHGALTSAWQTLSAFHIAVPQRTDLFVYFKSLDEALTALNKSHGIDLVEAAMVHVNYLADKAGCQPAVILGGVTLPPMHRSFWMRLPTSGRLCTRRCGPRRSNLMRISPTTCSL
jgi:hypothetical protein